MNPVHFRRAMGITVMVRAGGRRLDGCGARRGHFLEMLDPPARVVEVPAEAGLAAVGSFLVECWRGEGPMLLFYPELPFVHPVTWVKLVPGLMLYVVARVLLGRRAFWVDVVDIVRWQEVSLHLKRRASPRVVRLFEGLLFRMADEVRVPSRELAHWLSQDLAIPPSRFRVLPHAPPAGAASPAAARPSHDKLRFVYAGGLSLDEDRGIRQLVDAFRREAPGWAELHLAGEHGEWLADLRPVEGLRYHGLLSEPELIELVRRCDFGLIPYPEWGYYRTVLPAKLSFYESCGVGVVSTELPEVMRWIEGGGRGRALPYRHFGALFRRHPELAQRNDQ